MQWFCGEGGKIAQGQTAQTKDPMGWTGKDGSSYLEHIWKRWHCLAGDKITGRQHPFWDKTALVPAKWDPPTENLWRTCHNRSLKFWALILSWTSWDTAQEALCGRVGRCLRHKHGEGRDLRDAWDMGGEMVHSSGRALPRVVCENSPLQRQGSWLEPFLSHAPHIN